MEFTTTQIIEYRTLCEKARDVFGAAMADGALRGDEYATRRCAQEMTRLEDRIADAGFPRRWTAGP